MLDPTEKSVFQISETQRMGDKMFLPFRATRKSHTTGTNFWNILRNFKNFYFAFMNKHNIIQISPSHILQTVSIKAFLVIPFSRNPHNTETSQLIANKLTIYVR